MTLIDQWILLAIRHLFWESLLHWESPWLIILVHHIRKAQHGIPVEPVATFTMAVESTPVGILGQLFSTTNAPTGHDVQREDGAHSSKLILNDPPCGWTRMPALAALFKMTDALETNESVWCHPFATGPCAIPGPFLTSTRSAGDVCTTQWRDIVLHQTHAAAAAEFASAEDAHSDGPNSKNLQMSFADHRANPR
eukprot:s2509_g11.t1